MDWFWDLQLRKLLFWPWVRTHWDPVRVNHPHSGLSWFSEVQCRKSPSLMRTQWAPVRVNHPHSELRQNSKKQLFRHVSTQCGRIESQCGSGTCTRAVRCVNLYIDGSLGHKITNSTQNSERGYSIQNFESLLPSSTIKELRGEIH